MKVAIAGTGYVGLSTRYCSRSTMRLSPSTSIPEKVAMLNRKESPIEDAEIEHFLKHKPLNFRATLDKADAYRRGGLHHHRDADGYDPETNYFNTSSIEAVIRDVMAINPDAVMVIKSTDSHWVIPSARGRRSGRRI